MLDGITANTAFITRFSRKKTFNHKLLKYSCIKCGGRCCKKIKQINMRNMYHHKTAIIIIKTPINIFFFLFFWKAQESISPICPSPLLDNEKFEYENYWQRKYRLSIDREIDKKRSFKELLRISTRSSNNQTGKSL